MLAIIHSDTLQASGNTTPKQQFSPSLLTIFPSSTHQNKMPTISSKPFAPSTPFLRIGTHTCTLESHWNGTTPPDMLTDLCQNMSLEHYTSFNKLSENFIPTVSISQKILHTNTLNQTMVRRFNTQNPPMMHPL